MSERIVRYPKGEIGRVRVVEGFLPAPDRLVPRADSVKVTLSLSRRRLDFFTREAKNQCVPYQRVTRSPVVYMRSGRSAVGWAKARSAVPTRWIISTLERVGFACAQPTLRTTSSS